MGTCLVAFARSFSTALSVFHMELEACRAGLLIAIHEEMKNGLMWIWRVIAHIWLRPLRALVRISMRLVELWIIVGSTWICLTPLMFIVKQIVWPIVWHTLLAIFWLDETSSIIRDVLYEDFYSCTRGSSSTYFSRVFPAIINKRLEDK